MGLTGCMRCLKYTVFVINLLFWLAGMALLCISLWLRFNPDTEMMMGIGHDLQRYHLAVYILMGAGGLMTLLGFIGCYGAIRESQCFLVTFFILLVVLFAAEIGGGIYAYQNRDELSKFARTALQKSVKKEYGLEPIQTKAINHIQKTLKCCGAESVDDWSRSHWSTQKDTQDIGVEEGTLKKVPTSCCTEASLVTMGENCGNFVAVMKPDIYKMGCSEKLGTFFRNNIDIVVGIGVGIAIAQFLGAILTVVLILVISQEKKREKYYY